MAKQKGILRFVGKIGRKVYYYHKYFGYLVRKVTSVDAERIRQDPAFARVRDNNAEFAHGAWVVRLIRAAFLPLFEGLSDTRMTSRLTSRVLAAIRAVEDQAPGQRRFEDAPLDAVIGFDFNLHASLCSEQVPQHSVSIEYASGTCTLSIPGMNVRKFCSPKGATHVRFVMGVASIDIKTGKHALNTVSPPEMSLYAKAPESLVITGALPARASSHVFVTLGVEFFQAVNDDLYALRSVEYDALTLVYAARTPVRCKGKFKRSVRCTSKIQTAVCRRSRVGLPLAPVLVRLGRDQCPPAGGCRSPDRRIIFSRDT